MNRSKREVEEALRERDYWKELEAPLGWRLMGWSYMAERGTATYYDDVGQTVHLTGRQKDAILRAIELREDLR